MEPIDLLNIIVIGSAFLAEVHGIVEAMRQGKVHSKIIMVLGLCALLVAVALSMQTAKDRNEARARHKEVTAQLEKQQIQLKAVKIIISSYVAAHPGEQAPLVQQLGDWLNSVKLSAHQGTPNLEMSLHTNILDKAVEYANAADLQTSSSAEQLKLLAHMAEQVRIYHGELSRIQPCGLPASSQMPPPPKEDTRSPAITPGIENPVPATSSGTSNRNSSVNQADATQSLVDANPAVSPARSNSLSSIGATNGALIGGGTNGGVPPAPKELRLLGQ